MPRTLTVEGRLTAADTTTRILRGRLLPFGEAGRTSAGACTASAGSITWPADVAAVVLNLGHDTDRPVGRATSIVEAPDGLHATFTVAAVPAGDQLLAEAAAGLRTGLSVELDTYSIRGGRLTAGTLTGVGAVVKPAFPSAQLTAADTEPPQAEATRSDTDVPCPVCGEPVALVVSVLSDQSLETPAPTCPHCGAWLTVAVPGGDTPDDPPADLASEGDPMPTALAATHTRRRPAAAPAGARPSAARAPLSVAQAAALTASAANGGAAAGARLTAALADVVGGGVGDIYGRTTEAGWLGELWSGREYTRRYVPLATASTITGTKMRGWRWVTKPVVADWPGDKAPVPSNEVEVEAAEASVERCAGAWDIDRVFWDLGDSAFIESFWRMTVESYAKLSDLRAAEALVEAATANPTVAGAVPAGVSPGMAAIIDGALALVDHALPEFALVSADLYRGVLLTRSDDALTYLNAALGLEDGTLAGFSIKPAPASILPAGSVVVGAKQAVTFGELGQVPIRVEAEDVARGGRDVGAFGYTASLAQDTEAITLVTTG